MKSVLLFTTFCLTISSFSFAASTPLDKRQDCQASATAAVYNEFKGTQGYSDEEMDSLAVVEDATVEPDQVANTLSVRVNSANVIDWDGYADYIVTMKVSEKSCKATKVVLQSGEGI